MSQSQAKWTLINSLLVIILTAVFLRGIGQPVWCKCNGWSLWSWDIWSSHNSQHFIDPYSATHMLHGVVLCGLLFLLPRSVSVGTRFLLAITIEAGWEILENSPFIIERYRETTISKDYFGDSVANSIGDILSCALGYVIAWRLRFATSILLFAATELVLLLWIRDCLILNVLMLVYPIEWIEQWQMGLA